MALLRLRARNGSRDSDARRAATAPSGHERGEGKGTGTWRDLAGRSAGDSPPPEAPVERSVSTGTPRPARASVMQRVILPEQLFLCGAAVWSTAAALSNASNSQRDFGIAGAISGAELGKDGGE